MVFFQASTATVEDERRKIEEVVFPTTILQSILQLKVITFSEEAIEGGLVVGNHFHKRRHEAFVAFGPEGPDLFVFKYRPPGGEIIEKRMKAGDGCCISPLHSHAFVGLVPGATLWGVSNAPYSKEDEKPDQLF